LIEKEGWEVNESEFKRKYLNRPDGFYPEIDWPPKRCPTCERFFPFWPYEKIREHISICTYKPRVKSGNFTNPCLKGY